MNGKFVTVSKLSHNFMLFHIHTCKVSHTLTSWSMLLDWWDFTVWPTTSPSTDKVLLPATHHRSNPLFPNWQGTFCSSAVTKVFYPEDDNRWRV